VNWGKFAPAWPGHPEVVVRRISATLLGRVIRGELRQRASDAAYAGQPPPRRRDTYKPSKYM
jgi:hypothetical protein